MTSVSRGKHVAQGAAAVAATAVLAATGVTNHAALAASVAMLGHLRWTWILAVVVLESASMALVNWLADAAVFAVSIQAVGAAIPWHVLLLAYSSGVGAQTLNVTPGGFGITEGTLGLTLVAAGLRVRQALAAVLL